MSLWNYLDDTLQLKLALQPAYILTDGSFCLFFQVILLFWGTGLLQALVKIVIAGAFGLNISKKITEERSTLRKEFYIKFAKVIFCLFESQFVIIPTKQLPKGKSRDTLHVIHILKFFQS